MLDVNEKSVKVLYYDQFYREHTLKLDNTPQAKFVFNWECPNCNTTASTSYLIMAQCSIVPRKCKLCQFPYSPYPAFRSLTGPKDEPI